jgi:hypothetical protein
MAPGKNVEAMNVLRAARAGGRMRAQKKGARAGDKSFDQRYAM